MNKLIIAMKDKHQSQKLAIVLSSSYDSVIVDSSIKLKELMRSTHSDIYSIIFEEEQGKCDFSKELINLRNDGKIDFTVVRILPSDCEGESSDTTINLSKPFGVKELVTALNRVSVHCKASSIAIA